MTATWEPWKLTTGEPYRLVPHPLDAVGTPPPPGPDYDTAWLLEAVEVADDYLQADELREEADRLREDADEAEDDADKADRAATKRQAAFAVDHPLLAAAIKADPDKFRTTGAVREWVER